MKLTHLLFPMALALFLVAGTACTKKTEEATNPEGAATTEGAAQPTQPETTGGEEAPTTPSDTTGTTGQ